MSEPLRYITLPNGQKATHKMSWGTSDFGNGEQPFIYSEIQEDDNGELKDFGKDAMKRAIQKKTISLLIIQKKLNYLLIVKIQSMVISQVGRISLSHFIKWW